MLFQTENCIFKSLYIHVDKLDVIDINVTWLSQVNDFRFNIGG